MKEMPLMGDEAIALGAVHAGLTAAYAYPGTPSTEILETLIANAEKEGIKAQWCSNEKTAYESALGTSFAGRRTMVSMKHVGLNVAADPFINSSLTKINGGLVLVVADDPGMHSSQDEQDSRFFASFARIPCLEPADQQQAYDMTLEAFELSERWHVPVMLRIVTRLAHGRGSVLPRAKKAQNPVKKAENRMDWILMPSNARKRWHILLGEQREFAAYSEASAFNPLELASKKVGVITTGIAREYFRENLGEMADKPSWLHVGCYPFPVEKIRKLAEHCERIVLLEEGYPLIERELRGLLPQKLVVVGKETGEVPPEGELNPDNVRPALGLPAREGLKLEGLELPSRPPQLCQGCPHIDTFNALNEALKGYANFSVNSDIGCYTLGALPPYNAIESTVDMGASIGMARGASEAGLTPAVAVIGDSTFYHSGLPNLVDAVSHGTDMTLIILDNETTGMTGAQPTIMPSSRMEGILKGIGVDPAHLRVISAHRNDHDKNVAIIKEELAWKGPSVIVAVRVCLEAAKKARKA